MNENNTTDLPEGQENTTPEYTEVEQRALEMGWRPKEEFNGAEHDFIDAKEYVNRKPLFDKIEYQSKELKNVRRALEALKTHYTKVQETEYERALVSLKEERKQALNLGDGDKFDQVDEQIKLVEKQAAQIKQIQDTPIVQDDKTHPEFESWVSRNNWYKDTSYMRDYADQVGTDLAAKGMSPSDVLKAVEKAVRTEFPQKFRNPNKDNAPDVGDSRGTRANASRGTTSDEAGLTEIERKIMNDLVRSKTMTKEQYLADLKAIKAN